jgi:hypothetical protein
MIFRFGNYSCDNGVTELVISKRAQFTSAGVPYLVTEQWGASITLLPPDGSSDLVADLTTKIAACEAGFKQVNVDAFLLTESGGATAHSILHSQTLGGIRVIQPPSFPRGTGADYATYRSTSVGIEADVICAGTPPLYLQFQESLQTQGGGPFRVWTMPIVGLPQRQIPRQAKTYLAVQSGTATGFLQYPPVPPALFPGALSENPVITRTAPRRNAGGTFSEYGVSWQYVYESSSPLIGVPHAQLID